MRTTSDELLKKCGLWFITSPEAEELARRSLYIHAMLVRKEEEYDLLNVFTEALPFLAIDCKERIAQNECTAK